MLNETPYGNEPPLLISGLPLLSRFVWTELCNGSDERTHRQTVQDEEHNCIMIPAKPAFHILLDE